MARSEWELLPEFSAELEEIRKNGITTSLLYDILTKHAPNAEYNRRLYKRYMGITEGVPIFSREQFYEEEEEPINNKVNNDFFGEIVDFKVGYFAGEPISYGYSDTDEAEDATGGKKAIDEASKTLTDFTTRNNMFGVDMETTKYASIYGYAGRLFYVDKEGNERVMPIHGYETIILSDTDISEPEYAIRYYQSKDLNGAESWTVEFYDNTNVIIYKGSSLHDLEEAETKAHLFDYCPLQGVANNKEHIGDAEKVLALIDDYDKVVSDNSNEIEAFVHAMLLISQNVDDEVVHKAQKSGALIIPPLGSNAPNEPVKWLTKNINDTFTEHHLQRVEDNIYRFSRTPNLGDESFGSASGISLKFKLHGLETKCATFEANVMNSAQYMWKVLCSAWAKKGIKVDPLQIVMEFHRNFPQDELANAQIVQAYIGAGLPKRFAYTKVTDDVEWIMQTIAAEQEESMALYERAEQEMNNQSRDTEKMEKKDEEKGNNPKND